MFISPNVLSQQESDDESVELQPISVTGTRIKRTDVEDSTSLTIIDREMIEASGQVTIAQLLHSSTYNSSGSFCESSGWSNGLSGAVFVNLRGLGPEHTLVLLNVRHLSPYTPCCRYPFDFDINSIASGSNLYDLQGRVL